MQRAHSGVLQSCFGFSIYSARATFGGPGAKTHHLKNMDCSKGHRLSCHYYPPCPEPELAIGATKHSDFRPWISHDSSTKPNQRPPGFVSRSVDWCWTSSWMFNHKHWWSPPAEYREVVLRDYVKKFLSTGLDDQEIGLDYHKLWRRWW